ncbi:hypothetical protein, partial [Bacillus subtilis]
TTEPPNADTEPVNMKKKAIDSSMAKITARIFLTLQHTRNCLVYPFAAHYNIFQQMGETNLYGGDILWDEL